MKARLLRWGLAALLILIGIWLSVPGGHVVCQDELAHVGKNAVVRTCGPLGLTALPVVASVLLLVVLLGPDLSEVSIGVLSLKQRVDETQRNQKEIQEEFEGLKQSFVIATSASAEQTTSVATSVEAPDLPGLVREIVRGVSANPALAGAEEHAGGVDPKYASTLGNVVLTLARLEFLLGSRSMGLGPKIRFWIIEIGSGPSMMQLSQSEAFADLVRLIDGKDPAALFVARASFREEYDQVLKQLASVREFAINGVISLSEAESTLNNARILLGALTIKVEQLPRADRDAATLGNDSADSAKEISPQEEPGADHAAGMAEPSD